MSVRTRFPNPFNLFLIAFIAVVMFALPAYAGIGDIFGKVGGFISGKALEYLITAGIGALGAFGLSYKLWGKVAKELGETIWTIVKALDKDGPGGKKITAEEMQDIISEALEIYPSTQAAIASHKKAETVM